MLRGLPSVAALRSVALCLLLSLVCARTRANASELSAAPAPVATEDLLAMWDDAEPALDRPPASVRNAGEGQDPSLEAELFTSWDEPPSPVRERVRQLAHRRAARLRLQESCAALAAQDGARQHEAFATWYGLPLPLVALNEVMLASWDDDLIVLSVDPAASPAVPAPQLHLADDECPHAQCGLRWQLGSEPKGASAHPPILELWRGCYRMPSVPYRACPRLGPWGAFVR